MSYGNYKHILGVLSFHNFVFNCISIIKTTYWVPLVLSCQRSLLSPTGHFFFFFFPLFFLSLLFFIYSSSKQKSHTHRPLTPKSSYLPTTHAEKLILIDILTRKVKRSSASIFDHTPKSFTMRSFSSSLLLYSFFYLAEASKSASIATVDLY